VPSREKPHGRAALRSAAIREASPAEADALAPPPPAAEANQQAARAAGTSRRALKNWRVRSRLILLIVIPTLTALALGGARIATSAQSALSYQRIEQLANLSSAVTGLSGRLEDERDQTTVYAADQADGSPAAATQLAMVKKQYARTDTSVADVRRKMAAIGAAYPSQVRQDVAAVRFVLGNLPAMRYAAVKENLGPLVTIEAYASSIGYLIEVDGDIALNSGDPALGSDVRALGIVSRIEEETSEQRAILAYALAQQKFAPGLLSAFTTAEAETASDISQFTESALPSQTSLYHDTVSGGPVELADEYEQQAVTNTTSLSSIDVTEGAWYSAMSGEILKIRSVENNLVAGAVGRASALRRSAIINAIAIGAAVIIVLILALMLTSLVGRSLVRPLRRLRAGALEVAGKQLPETVRRMSEGDGTDVPITAEPIDVDSSDEIGEVARAFDQVHREALRLAANEAALRGNVNAMFVNLSRRSQSLVERQIRLIDDLEQGEQDAERLSNLFQMDHLATRMRRNSENLLVLAGYDSSRRWTQPVALIDVIRAAVSEIEQYERVTMNAQPGVAVRGPAVNDVVHLIAELAENATSFSSTETPVAVSGHLLNSGGVLLDITDQGVGIGAEEMAHANWRLDNPPVVDVAVSRRMGLFVVARLAARHGIRVRLRPAPAGGLTALVWLPDEVVTHEAAGASPGARRFERAPGTVELPSSVGPFAAEWPPGDRSAAEQAVSAARAPRFTPLRAENGDGASAFGQLNASWERNPPTGPMPQVPGPGPVFGAPVSASVDVPVRPDQPYGAEASLPNRLPIFEAVESDWFRRGKHSDGGSPGESAPEWRSASDEGWRAAEAVHAPSSGGVTLSGLPKRVPNANLVPGTAGGESSSASAGVAPTARSAAVTRDRFASFQRGVREGRAALRSEDDPGGEGNGE
jgi:signal transduction histidine kinase